VEGVSIAMVVVLVGLKFILFIIILFWLKFFLYFLMKHLF